MAGSGEGGQGRAGNRPLWCMELPVVMGGALRGLCAKSLQSCLTLCDRVDCSPPGSSVHGILQARILGWIAMPSSRGSS